jgi:hypothetical protein
VSGQIALTRPPEDHDIGLRGDRHKDGHPSTPVMLLHLRVLPAGLTLTSSR